MPVVKIDMWEGRDDAMKEDLVRKVSAAVAESLGIEERRVWVIVDETPRGNWSCGGKLGTEL